MKDLKAESWMMHIEKEKILLACISESKSKLLK